MRHAGQSLPKSDEQGVKGIELTSVLKRKEESRDRKDNAFSGTREKLFYHLRQRVLLTGQTCFLKGPFPLNALLDDLIFTKKI